MKKPGLLILNCALLLLVDVVTLLLFFSSWFQPALTVFPFALLNIMAVLVVLNLTVFLALHIQRSFRGISSASLITAAVLLYVFILCFTWLAYSWISVTGYLLISLLAFAAYLASVTVIYLVGRRGAGKAAEGEQRVTIQDMQRLLMELETAVHGLQGLLTPRQYESLCRAFSDLREKVYFSTPFGRTSRPVVLDMEKRVEDRLERIISRMMQPPADGRDDWIGGILSGLMDTTELLKNREKQLPGR